MRILKIKDWLKFQNTDYDGFVEHVRSWERFGIQHEFAELIELAKNYNIQSPKVENGTLTFNVDITQLATPERINLEMTINPTSQLNDFHEPK